MIIVLLIIYNNNTDNNSNDTKSRFLFFIIFTHIADRPTNDCRCRSWSDEKKIHREMEKERKGKNYGITYSTLQGIYNCQNVHLTVGSRRRTRRNLELGPAKGRATKKTKSTQEHKNIDLERSIIAACLCLSLG